MIFFGTEYKAKGYFGFGMRVAAGRNGLLTAFVGTPGDAGVDVTQISLHHPSVIRRDVQQSFCATGPIGELPF